MDKKSNKDNLGLRSVLVAVTSNVVVGISKLTAFVFTGSGVMLSEGIHSIADITNQVFLLIGIKRSQKPADEKHNYGYRSERFFWSLLSACGVFFIGAGVTVYHGISTLIQPEKIEFSIWTVIILALAFVVEGFSLYSAYRELRAQAKEENFVEFARHSGDPTLLAILYEDSAALLGIIIALFAVFLTQTTGLLYWDSIGSILIGILLGGIAIALMNINRDLLIGRSIPPQVRKRIFTILMNQRIVDEVHDFKTVMIATDGYRVKAEVEINGHVLADKIFEHEHLKDDYENIKSYEDFVKFCSHFSDKVTRTLGKEIDLLEEEVEEEVPTVKHIDIEAN